MSSLTPGISNGAANAISAPSQAPVLAHRDRPHIRALDGIRGVAAIAVFFFHYGDFRNSGSILLRCVTHIKERGAYGVDIFFALSGFLITGILWDMRHADHRWGSFYRNRALRLFPLYYGVWALLALYCIVVHHPWYRSNYAYLFYAGNFVSPFPALNHIGPFGISHFWSLACEEQFYLIWPAVVWGLRDIERLKRVAAIACVSSVALKLFGLAIHLNGRWAYALLPFRLEGLCAGACLALMLRTDPARTLRLGGKLVWVLVSATVAFFLLSALLHFSAPVEHAFAFGLVGGASATVIAAALDPRSLAARLFGSTALRVAGKYSYGIYVYSVLLHDVFKQYVLPRIAHAIPGHVASGVVYLVVVMLLTLLISAASFHLLERPFLKLKHHGAKSRPVGAAA